MYIIHPLQSNKYKKDFLKCRDKGRKMKNFKEVKIAIKKKKNLPKRRRLSTVLDIAWLKNTLKITP